MTRIVLDMEIPGKKTRGRPRIRWMDNIRRYMRLHGLDESMTEDRKVWSTRVAKVDTLSGDEAVAVQTPRVLVPDTLLYSLGPQQNGDTYD